MPPIEGSDSIIVQIKSEEELEIHKTDFGPFPLISHSSPYQTLDNLDCSWKTI